MILIMNVNALLESEMFLTTIGLIGLMTVIGKYRKPDVKFFSFITVFNRKEKLTERGAKFYLVFFFIIIAGIILRVVTSG